MVKKISTVIFCVVFFVGCYYDNEEDLYPFADNCNTTDVKFRRDIQPIISKSCATSGCHVPGGTGVGNFQVFGELKSKVDDNSFNNRVFVQRNMPPDEMLSSCEIQKLQAWVEQGAPNN